MRRRINEISRGSCCRMKFRVAIKYFGVCLLVYYTTKLMAVHFTGSIQAGHHDDTRTSFDFELMPDIVSEEHGVNMSRCDTVIHVASMVTGPDAARKFSYLLKSVLYFRRSGLQFHLLTDETSRTILKRLLETWELPLVSWRFIYTESLLPQVDETNKMVCLQALLPFILPKSVEQVIFLGIGVRLLDNIEHLWKYFQDFAPHQKAYAIPATTSFIQNKDSILDILLLRISDNLRKTSVDLETIANTAKTKGIQAVLNSIMNNQPYVIPCQWSVYISQSYNLRQCIERNQTKTLILDPLTDTPRVDPAIKPYITKLKSVLSYDAELYREQQICSLQPSKASPEESSDGCRKYRTESGMKRRTHLHFIPQGITSVSDPTEIAVVTQFTLDRFETFERFMLNWEGATVVVLHVTDAEALTLPERIAQSDALKNRQQISYHLVFKRGDYYPINYLRNVGLSVTNTPYLLFVDVDLVPNPGIHRILKRYIQKHMLHRDNVTLVVPAFEAFEEINNFPRDKAAILKLLEQKKVDGYRMQRKWNLGHKPTDYEKWKTTNVPYKVQWRDAFEPYVVLRSKIAPEYTETLLERMGDKIAYGREVFARGYEFMVLPDVFIIHLPHELSPGTKKWKAEKSYLRCGARLFNEYRKELQHRYPSVNFN